MINEDAIKNLKKLRSFHNGSYAPAIDKAIEALKEERPTGDTISREALKKTLKEKTKYLSNREYLSLGIYDIIDNAPSVEPKRGEWIEGENGNIKCNRCECEIRYSYLIGNEPDFPNFCPNCGAIMKGGAK